MRWEQSRQAGWHLREPPRRSKERLQSQQWSRMTLPLMVAWETAHTAEEKRVPSDPRMGISGLVGQTSEKKGGTGL